MGSGGSVPEGWGEGLTEPQRERLRRHYESLITQGVSPDDATRRVKLRAEATALVRGGGKLQPVDAAKYINLGGHGIINGRVEQLKVEDTYEHCLMHSNTRYHDEMLLGIRGQQHQSGISSGMRIQQKAPPHKTGKTSICVEGGGHGKFLVYWDTGEQGYAYGQDIEAERLPNEGWTKEEISKIGSKIDEVIAKGGVRACLSDDREMLSFMDAVWENFQASLGVFDECYDQVRNDPAFSQLAQISSEIPAGKPRQPEGAVRDGESLFKHALAAKPLFEVALNRLAKATQAEAHAAPLKRVFRSCEKVHTHYAKDWRLLTDVVRGTLVAETLAGVCQCVRAVQADDGVEILRCKNKFCDPDENLGYRDFSMLVRVAQSDHICELQVHLRPYIAVKQSGAHKVYAQARALALC